MNGYPLTALAHLDLDARRAVGARERLGRRTASNRRSRRTSVRRTVDGYQTTIYRESTHAVCSL